MSSLTPIEKGGAAEMGTRLGTTHRGIFSLMAAAFTLTAVATALAGYFTGDAVLAGLGLLDGMSDLSGAPAGGVVLLSAGALLCIAVGLLVCFSGVSNASMTGSVEGRIVSSRLRSFPCDEGMEHYVFSTVSYESGGRKHEAEGRHGFSGNDAREIRNRMAAIRPGDRVTVHLNPSDPEVIDLDEPPKERWGSALGGLAMALAGFALLFLAGYALRG